MTDFIHEQPKEEPEKASPAPAASEEPELDERTGQKRVFGYIFILFIVAFSLLLWSFFMNQRSTDEVLSELRGNTGAMQTAMERNIELEKQIDAMEQEMDTLSEEKISLEGKLAEAQTTLNRREEESQALRASRDVCYAQILMDEGNHEAAAVTLALWNTAELRKALDSPEAAAQTDSEPPDAIKTRFDAMVEQLAGEGYLTVAAEGQLKYWHIDRSNESLALSHSVAERGALSVSES